MLAVNYWTEHWVPDGGIGKGLKELRGFAALRGATMSISQIPPEVPGTETPTKETLMALAAYVSEDNFNWHAWQERLIVL